MLETCGGLGEICCFLGPLRRHCSYFKGFKRTPENYKIKCSAFFTASIRLFSNWIQNGSLALYKEVNTHSNPRHLVDAWRIGADFGSEIFQNALVNTLVRFRDDLSPLVGRALGDAFSYKGKNLPIQSLMIDIFLFQSDLDIKKSQARDICNAEATQEVVIAMLEVQQGVRQPHFGGDGCEFYHTHKQTEKCKHLDSGAKVGEKRAWDAETQIEPVSKRVKRERDHGTSSSDVTTI